MNQIGKLITDPAQLVFIDEAARNKKNTTRKQGWSLAGTWCSLRRCFIRGQRFSILPALSMDGIIAHDIVPESVTSATFVKFLREHLVRQWSFHHLISTELDLSDPSHEPISWSLEHYYC